MTPADALTKIEAGVPGTANRGIGTMEVLAA